MLPGADVVLVDAAVGFGGRPGVGDFLIRTAGPDHDGTGVLVVIRPCPNQPIKSNRPIQRNSVQLIEGILALLIHVRVNGDDIRIAPRIAIDAVRPDAAKGHFVNKVCAQESMAAGVDHMTRAIRSRGAVGKSFLVHQDGNQLFVVDSDAGINAHATDDAAIGDVLRGNGILFYAKSSSISFLQCTKIKR